MEQWFNQVNSERNNALRKIFGKFMKQSLMIKLKEEIKKSPEFLRVMQKCYNLNVSPIICIGADDVDFDICSNLAMINYYLMLPISNNKETQSEKYNCNEYITMLKKRTIMQCNLRLLIQNYEERNFLSAHMPINFSMHCSVNYLLDKIYEKLKHKKHSSVLNANFKINTLIIMLKTIRSILVLTEYDDCGNAFSLLRTLIETMAVYYAIYDNEKVAIEYYKFMQYREFYEATGQYSEEFEKIAPLNCTKQNFLNYGWLDKLNGKHNKYVFGEVIACNKKAPENEIKLYLKSYKYCCKYAHGNYLNQAIPAHSFLWILGIAGTILVNLSRQYSYIFQEIALYNEVNLEEYLISNVEESLKIYEEIQREQNNNTN